MSKLPNRESTGTGRPSIYTPELAEEICERISRGETLRSICRLEGMPGWVTVYRWLNEIPELSERFAHAREAGHDAIAEEALEIADESSFDMTDGPDGQLRTNNEAIQRSKLRVETRLKLLAKWSPKKYGDRSAMELTGANGGPVQISDAERNVKAAGLLALAQSRRNQERGDDAEDH